MPLRTVLIATLYLSLSLLITSCFKEPLYHSQSYVFGTLVDISIYGESDERATQLASHITQTFQSLNDRLHAWKPISKTQLSELGELNAAFAVGKPVAISPELAAILKDASALSKQSLGLFNPSIGQLIGTWGFQHDEFQPVNVDAAQIQALVKAAPAMGDIVLERNQAYSKNPAVKLDLGGYAKGYALDIAAGYLRSQGVKHALINIGGNIIALGQHGDKPWRVGIQHPRNPNAIATLDLKDGWAIGTSGDYQRYFMLNGKRYCHIIDPRSGYPVQHTQAVTVLIPPGKSAGVLSDVASKPIFIAAPPDKAEAAAGMGVTHYMVIDAAAHIAASKSMAQQLHWANSDVKFSTLP